MIVEFFFYKHISIFFVNCWNLCLCLSRVHSSFILLMLLPATFNSPPLFPLLPSPPPSANWQPFSLYARLLRFKHFLNRKKKKKWKKETTRYASSNVVSSAGSILFPLMTAPSRNRLLLLLSSPSSLTRSLYCLLAVAQIVCLGLCLLRLGFSCCFGPKTFELNLQQQLLQSPDTLLTLSHTHTHAHI